MKRKRQSKLDPWHRPLTSEDVAAIKAALVARSRNVASMLMAKWVDDACVSARLQEGVPLPVSPYSTLNVTFTVTFNGMTLAEIVQAQRRKAS